MQGFLEEIAETNGLRDQSPSLKLLLGLGCMILCVSSSGPLAPLFVAFTMSLVIIFMARVPVWYYLRLLLIPLTFALTSTVVILFLTGGGEVIWVLDLSEQVSLSVTTESLNQSILVLARVAGGMCSLFFISLTTPVTEIFSLMRLAKFPQEFIDLSMLMYRFIFVFIEEAGMIYRSQTMRLGYGSFMESVRSSGMLAGALFLRTWESGENLILAMDARCYDGRFALLEDTPTLSVKSLILVISYLVLVLVIACLTRNMTIFEAAI